MGQATAIAVGSSVTSVPLALADILAAEHSINVHESMPTPWTSTSPVATSAARPWMATPTWRSVSAEQNASGLSGVAWLHDNGDDTTTVSVFLAATGTASAPGASMLPGPSEVPGSSMLPGPSELPGSSMLPAPSMVPGASTSSVP